MKKLVHIFFAFLMSVSFCFAQDFQQSKGFSFQGYARDFDGAALGNQTIVVRFSIYPEGSDVVYQEEQTLDTNPYGVFSATVGSISPNDFSTLEFSQNNYWLRVETKANNSDFAVISETELLAVPYAKAAENGIPVGTILPFGGPASNVPPGFLPCDGSEVRQDDYPRLYAAIADAWGEGTGNNFRLPDLRGYFLRGLDAGSGNDPDAASRTALAGGNTGDNVGSYQTDENKNHSHTGDTNTAGSHNHSIGGDGASDVKGGSEGDYVLENPDGDGAANFNTDSDGNHSHTLDINDAGGSESRPKNAYVLFIIKY